MPFIPGKSVFQLYAARRFCAERKPFIWFEQRYYLFFEDAVYILPNDFPRQGFKSRIRTLVDSDAADRIPGHLLDHGTYHFVIFSTSPHKERWSRLSKTSSYSLHQPVDTMGNPSGVRYPIFVIDLSPAHVNVHKCAPYCQQS
jgi:hypothetical protein